MNKKRDGIYKIERGFHKAIIMAGKYKYKKKINLDQNNVLLIPK